MNLLKQIRKFSDFSEDPAELNDFSPFQKLQPNAIEFGLVQLNRLGILSESGILTAIIRSLLFARRSPIAVTQYRALQEGYIARVLIL